MRFHLLPFGADVPSHFVGRHFFVVMNEVSFSGGNADGVSPIVTRTAFVRPYVAKWTVQILFELELLNLAH